MERREVERHASSGPTPVRKSRKMPIGTATRLKKGGPIVTFDPCTYSLRTGKSVPQRMTKQATRRTRLLKRKLDSRETMDSSRFSLLRWSRCLKKVKRQTMATTIQVRVEPAEEPLLLGQADAAEPVNGYLFRRPADVAQHLPDLLAKRPRAVWLQAGIRDDRTAEALARAGILVVQDRCLMVDYRAIRA